MTKSLDSRYAIVTGAGSGLGRAFCLQLAKLGYHVAATDIDRSAAEKTVEMLVQASGTGQAAVLDVTDAEAWRRLLGDLRADWPRLDLLVNNAGICAAGNVDELSAEIFQSVMEVNFQGVLNGCRTMIPWLKENSRSGHIINIASVFGLVAPPSMGPYNVSKAAVVALSETLYGELMSMGIGVTVVAPGFFSSHLLDEAHFTEEQQRQIAEQYMGNAQLTADEVVLQALTAAQEKRLYVVPGRKARWIWRLKRWFPARIAKLIVWRYRKKRRAMSCES